jgi:Zn-finger nucleic acid-binding protein
MQCPNCKSSGLRPLTLAERLTAFTCPNCAGHWIRGEHYFAWVEKQPKTPVEPAPTANVADSTQAKLCADCGRLLRRSRVGRGAEFTVDRCGQCGGIWLDAHEWEALQARGLHDEIHFVFSAAWQAQLIREEKLRQREARLKHILGEQDFVEIQRIKTWMEQHPRRIELHAYLMNDE